jgi:hypothetical protein
MESKLLTRDEFREGVFKRDGHKCVFCGQPAVDAHHIIERRIWGNGGYFLNNGASVCEEHHLACERTDISVEEVREKCGITKPILPEHLYHDQRYDKWGNIILPNGQRLKGELFYDESVQKIIKEHLGEFTHWVKYPRTNHVPWSQNMNEDDRMIPNMDSFKGKRIIVTEKMDGENTTMYNDHIHARSINSDTHISRNWVKNFWSGIAQEIPDGWRVCGENLWAKHSISYAELPTYFMGFSVWNDRNECLSWDETLEWFGLFGIKSVPVLYDGLFENCDFASLMKKEDWSKMEGYVIRLADKFSYGDFKKSVAKFVRAGHIQTIKHWMHGQAVERNGLAEKV